MNNYQRKKLGLTKQNHQKDIQKSEEKIAKLTPISLDKNVKDYNAYSKLNVKTINIGTLRKPVEKLVIYDNDTQGYYPLQIINKNVNPPYYFKENYSEISLNGEVFNYKTNLNIDQNNPYDPLFASFSRLSSFPPRGVIISGVTYLTMGDKERFFTLSAGFSKSTNIQVTNAGRSIVNGMFIPSGTLNNKTRYINIGSLRRSDLIWNLNPTGWLLRMPGWRLNSFDPAYFLPGNNQLPTGNQWLITGSPRGYLGGGSSGILPTPTSTQLDSEGFFKIATTRISNNQNKIYAKQIGISGLEIGSTKNSLPSSYSWVTYPHSYNIQNYPALRYNSILTFNSENPISDIVLVSTGIANKKIVYISPHSIKTFFGFWADIIASNRSPKVVISGKPPITPSIYQLASGYLLSVSSENYVIPKFDSYKNNDIYNLDGSTFFDTRPESILSGLNKELNYLYSLSGSGLLNDYYGLPNGLELAAEDIISLNEGIALLNTPSIFELLSGIMASGLITDADFITGYDSGLGTNFFDTGIRLKQEIPIKDTAFYKLYEPLYKKNTFNTGTWNGVIPSGVPFSIETIRTKNAEMRTPDINVYLLNSFINSNVSGSGSFQSVMPGYIPDRRLCKKYINPSDPMSCSYTGIKKLPFFGYGTFEGSKIKFSPNSSYEAVYLAEKLAQKQSKSKLYGYLWDKGILKGNSKSKKMMNLMNRKNIQDAEIQNNLSAGFGYYCKNNSILDPLSCFSYSGINSLPLGFKTRAGIRLLNNDLISNIDSSGRFIDWKKVNPYDYETVYDIPSGVYGCFRLKNGQTICKDPIP